MKKIKYPAFAVVLVFLAYCKTTKKAAGVTTTKPVAEKTPYTPSSKQMEVANVRWPNTSPDEVAQGQNIYVTKCVECHNAFDILEFSERKWLHEIEDMSPKAKLSNDEKLKLSKHILSYREANAPVMAK